MNRALAILFLSAALLAAPAVEFNGVFNGTSYDSDLMEMSHPFSTYYYDLNPAATNHIYSWSRPGSGSDGDFQNQEGKWLLPLLHSFAFAGTNWVLANDNGSLNSNATAVALQNIASLPPTNYNALAGVGTNEGVTMPTVITQPLGRAPHDSADGDSGAIIGNAGSMGAAAALGVPVIDLWHQMYTAAFIADQAGARIMWSGIGGSHFSQSGYLAMDIFELLSLGVETNIAAVTVNWQAATASTTHCVVSGLSLAGTNLSGTILYDRMPMAYDFPGTYGSVTITNDARGAFTLYPWMVDAMRFTLQVTNLPAGNYNVFMDGVLVDTATSSQLATGRNWFTNYNGWMGNQKTEVLGRKRDQAGVDRQTLVSHSPGSQGTLGADLVNYHSDSGNSTEVYPAAFTGTNYVTHMSADVGHLQQYDVAIHTATVQTNHSFTITQTGSGAGSVSNLTAGTVIFSQAQVHHFWFMNGRNFDDEDWMNDWIPYAVTTTNLALTRSKWQTNPAVVAVYQGHNALFVTSSAPRLFCRALYEPR